MIFIGCFKNISQLFSFSSLDIVFLVKPVLEVYYSRCGCQPRFVQIFYGQICKLVLEPLAIGKCILGTSYSSSQTNVTKRIDTRIDEFLKKFLCR